MDETGAAGYQTIALHALDALSEGDTRAKTLHRLRIYLRRLQAYLELLGEERNAEVMADYVSRLSPLRELHVFRRYLARLDATADVRIIRDRIKTVRKKLDRKQIYDKIRRRVCRHALPPIPTTPDWLAHRMTILRRTNTDRLRKLIAAAEADPRRKALHELRLKIKSIRYQEDWAMERPYARPDVVDRLKGAQSVLGDYEDLAQFRRLAVKFDLECLDRIEKDWRRARKKARALPAQLNEALARTDERHLRLVPKSRAASAF